MKTYLISTLLGLMVILFSCKEENIDKSIITEKEFDLIGSAQKGPFINGSDINIYELDNDFTPTGRTFQVNTDEKGYFELKGVKLVSPFVKLLADGFYYNEVSGDLSNERMGLKAFVDISEQKNININVLTNLEYERVQYLIASKGLSVLDAKTQSQKELLTIFCFDSIQIKNSESLDIIKSGDGDAVLLAVSSILQAGRTTAELSKLQADIILDMKEDGILNDSVIQSSLISQAATINLDKIKQNLITKYNELGIVLDTINDFDKYVDYFLKNSAFQYISPFEFPVSTSNGTNFLAINMNKFQVNTDYAFAVKMPDVGKLMIKIKRSDGNGLWWYSLGQDYGWKVSQYDMSKNEQTFTSTENNEIIDLPISFSDYGEAIVEYYYNESLTPSLTKTIIWGGYNNSEFQFRDESPMGHNLLALVDSSEIMSDSTYVIGVLGLSPYDVQFKMHFPALVTLEVKGGYGDYTYSQTDGQLEFELKGDENISEIIFKLNGEGQIDIESDLQFKDNTYLKRVVFLRNK